MIIKCLIALMLGLGAAFSEPSSTQTSDPSLKTQVVKPAKVKIYKMKGILESVNSLNNQLVIQKGDKKELLKIDEAAMIKINGKKGRVDNLKPGCKAKLYYEIKGDMKIVKRIKAKTSKMEQSKKKGA